MQSERHPFSGVAFFEQQLGLFLSDYNLANTTEPIKHALSE